MCDQFGSCCLFCARGEDHPQTQNYTKRGEWEHVSFSNGIIGGEQALRAAKEMDRRLGVADKIEYRPMGNGAYAAVFVGSKNKQAWMKAHKRVDYNAGYGDPCPGDFRKQYPREFE